MMIKRMVAVCSDCGTMGAARVLEYRVHADKSDYDVQYLPPVGWVVNKARDSHLCPKCAAKRRRRERLARPWKSLKRLFSAGRRAA